MARWEGFPRFERAGRLVVDADYGGDDDDPTPLALLRQPSYPAADGVRLSREDLIDLTEEDLRWLVEEVAPVVLKRMSERP